MFNYRYHVLVYYKHELSPIADTYFGTLNQFIRFADIFDLNKVTIECVDDVFEKDVDVYELLKIWRSR